MGRSRLHRSCVLAAAVALAAVPLAGCSLGGEPREAVEAHPGRIEANALTDVIVSEGGRVLRDIADAQADIHRDDLPRAEEKIDRADRMLDVIEESLPTSEVRQRIWVARRHLEYADIQEVADDLVPIYAAVARVESLAPADSIRRHLDQAKRRMESGDRKAAGRELARADQELLFVEIDLPLSSARRHLAEAREALARDTPESATQRLQQAEDDLVRLTGVARSPLEVVRWSLAKAVALYTRGDVAGAVKYVTLARQSAKQASSGTSEASSAALKELVDQLSDLDSRLATHRVDALDELQRLVDRSRALLDKG